MMSRAMHARTLGQRLGDVGGARLAVGRQEGGADEIVDIACSGHSVFDFGRRQQMHVHAEALRRGGEALDIRSSDPRCRRA